MTIAFAATLRSARADAITTFAGASALLRIYDGSRPATGGTATPSGLGAATTSV